MRTFLAALTTVTLVWSSPLFCDDEKLLKPEILSRALGHTFAKDLIETPGFQFDIPAVVAGMQDQLEGRPSPLSDDEYERAFDIIQRKCLEELSTANLTEADSFLDQNIKMPNIVELVPGKLQISVLEEGEGEITVKDSDTPLVLYSGKYLDDTTIEVPENEPTTIQMEQTIPGLQKGLVGAKKGEKRRLYIHPEFCHSPTDSQIAVSDPLMILDVTVLETNNSSNSDEDCSI